MKNKHFSNTNEKQIIIHYDEAGKAYCAQYREERIGHRLFPAHIISNETMAELERIVREAKKPLTADDKWDLYQEFNDCLNYYDDGFRYFGIIENQKALHKLIDAFEDMSPDGQETLINHFLKRAKLPYDNAYSIDFLAAAKGLMTEAKKQGRKRDYGTRTKYMLGHVAWNLLDSLGVEITATTNTGHLSHFISTLWKDPALGEFRGAPTDMREHLEKIEAERNSAVKNQDEGNECDLF